MDAQGLVMDRLCLDVMDVRCRLLMSNGALLMNRQKVSYSLRFLKM